MPVNVRQIYRELPVSADSTRAHDGLPESAKAHIKANKSVTNKAYARGYQRRHASKGKRKRTQTTATSTSAPSKKRQRLPNPRFRPRNFPISAAPLPTNAHNPSHKKGDPRFRPAGFPISAAPSLPTAPAHPKRRHNPRFRPKGFPIKAANTPPSYQ